MGFIKDLCKQHTNLTTEEIMILEQVSLQLPYISELSGSDIFIDALTRNDQDAIVLAWARPPGNSLYSTSVVGELAYHNNEPAVYHTIKTGEASRDVRAISQEGVPIAQTVTPIFNKIHQIIGVLIMERNISKELQQEEKVEFLSYTAEKLSNTLMYLSITDKNFEKWVGNGIFVLNKQGLITYANKIASKIFLEIAGHHTLGVEFFPLVPQCSSVNDIMELFKNPYDMDQNGHFYRFQCYPLFANGMVSGCSISVQDITDLKKKEKELNTRNIIIKEIHHRVKNNLQNIASLLRMQMRRSDSEIIRSEFRTCINRIMSVALVHETCAVQDWETIDLRTFCSRLLKLSLESSGMDPEKIVTKVHGPIVQLPSSQAVPLALVVNELITNSIKYGIDPVSGGHLSISFEERNGMINLTVTDGGWSETKKPSDNGITHKGLGLQIIESLVNDELNGFFRLEKKLGTTRAMVYFPKNYLEE